MSSRERIQKALDSLLYLPHLQAQHSDEPSLPVAAGSPPGGAAGGGGRGRPWDRGDLFGRLATFRATTWFCKPAAISPVECARRGWTNTAADLLTCEFCKAKVSCPVPADLPAEQAEAAAAQYARKLSEAHDAACPWRAGASSPSLLQFPPLTAESVRRDFDARCSALLRVAVLPPVAAEACEALAGAAGRSRLDALLQEGPPATGRVGEAPLAAGTDAAAAAGGGAAALGSAQWVARARLLALCGWDVKLMTAAPPALPQPAGPADPQAQQQQEQQQPAQLPSLVGPESAALTCGLCAARAGLWACFPQCKPLVLSAPRRRAGAHPTASVARTVSRNVAADLSTTIAGGAMAAAPGGGADGVAAAAQQPAASPAPFGAGAGAGSAPVFGLAALQSPRQAGEVRAGGEAARASAAALKRKQPDFSWDAVLTEINAKTAAGQRGKAAAAGAAGGTTTDGGAAAGARPGGRQQVAAAAAVAAKYSGAEVAPLDPLALHRSFCPWVNTTQAGEKEGRCGWRWCLQQLAAPAAPATTAVGDDLPPDAEGGEREGGGDGGKGWDPAQLLRSVLQQVDVRK